MSGLLNFFKGFHSLMKHARIASRTKADAVILWETEKHRYLIYKEPLDESIKEHSIIEEHLGKALENREFEVYYQPQILVDSGRITGFEALLRWNSPEMGFTSPDRFIGIAEETGLIVPIGEWVLKTACSFIKRLHNKGYSDLTMAVNVSIIQLMQEDFVKTIAEALKEVQLRPDCLELEITESILIESYESIGRKLELLKSMGVKIALDDFGRGYSSLSGLCRLPVHTLKIDKLFMDSFMDEGPEKDIIDLIIQIGEKMGLMVLAEGVENKAQAEYLGQFKSMKAQGFYYSKPLPHQRAESLVEKLLQQEAV